MAFYQKAIFQDTIDIIDSLMEVQLQNILQNRLSALSAVKTENQNVSTSASFETNLKDALDFRIRLYEGQSLSNTEWEDVEDIADLCVEQEGPGVLLARSMLNICDQKSYWMNEPVCPRSFTNAVNDDKLSFEVFPNPFSDFVHIKVLIEEEGTIRLIDNHARIIEKRKFQNRNEIIRLSTA